jgi:hypothetical protein
MQPNKEALHYTEALDRLHKLLAPKTYLEIGTLSGTTLRLARCASIAIDPSFSQLDKDVLAGKPSCLFFQMKSDEFFARYSPSVLFGCPVDIAFLDGMHFAEFLLRDFINMERHVRRNSLVMLHDCIPGSVEMATRHMELGAAWTGDVWKVVPILKKYRPDLRILALEAPPTGLVICTNLNPDSRILEDRYFAILEEFASLDLGKIGISGLRQLSGAAATDAIANHESITQHFWL